VTPEELQAIKKMVKSVFREAIAELITANFKEEIAELVIANFRTDFANAITSVMTEDSRKVATVSLKRVITELIPEDFERVATDSLKQAVNEEWLSTAQAYKLLGFVNAEQLRDRIRLGDFRLGYHYRDIRLPGRSKANYQFHIRRCRELLEQPPAQRKNHKEHKERKHGKAA